MKTGIYFLLVLTTLCWYGCGSPDTEATEGTTETTTVEENNAGPAGAIEDPSISAPTTAGASKITDEVVAKVCDCKKQATDAEGNVDNDVVRSCMGAESLPAYVEQLLGPTATDKERSDAENKLDERMRAC
jgi:hypothetical protein